MMISYSLAITTTILSLTGEKIPFTFHILISLLRLMVFAEEQLVVIIAACFGNTFEAVQKAVSNQDSLCTEMEISQTKLAWTIAAAESKIKAKSKEHAGVRMVFSTLSDALATFQKEVSLFLLFDVMQLTMNIVAFLAFIIVKGMEVNRSATFLIIFVDAVIRIVLLTAACGMATEEAEKVAEAASCSIHSDMEEVAKEELRMLMDEARCRQLKFWAFGLFTVDRPLLFSIVGTAISYLVVISQLQKE
ncbi:Hypothetical predicted protein [Cloeon dipterum]|uniref:Gustatory receptor n=1 Tax=Cloeon dipterum TaxID=197152 RepID=A0A8S1BSD0_9INSE|nr:Hypothetical predicted protein [Cloeon dipterum]